MSALSSSDTAVGAVGNGSSCCENGALLSGGGLTLKAEAQPSAPQPAVRGTAAPAGRALHLPHGSLPLGAALQGPLSDSGPSGPGANAEPGPAELRGRPGWEQKPPCHPPSLPRPGASASGRPSLKEHAGFLEGNSMQGLTLLRPVNPTAENTSSGGLEAPRSSKVPCVWFQLCLLFSESVLM